MTLEALDELVDAGLDAIKIDVKGPSKVYERYCGVRDGESVWETAEAAVKSGLHVEIVVLVVPGVNDDMDSLTWLIERHLMRVGADTPLHFTRYHPAYKMHHPPTPVRTLEYARELAQKSGVRYPYLGNVPGHPAENTYCPRCGAELIVRRGYAVQRMNISDEGRCPTCGEDIHVVL